MATVSVRVGCSWSNNHKAWNKSRIALKAVAKEVQIRLQPGKRHMLKAVPKQLDRIVEYRRLRATPGETISKSIISKIDIADILLFDVTPEKGHMQGKANVMFELGVAVCKKKKTYLISRGKKDPTNLASDLSGCYLSFFKGEKFEPALHMLLVNQCMKLFLRKNS